jgi:hypothetical protein
MPVRWNRRRSGQSLLELACALVVAVPIILILIDCGFIAAGVAVNDAACRDAARAAAGGPPSLMAVGSRTAGSGTDPMRRAKNVVDQIYKQTRLPVSIRDNAIEIEETVDSVPPPDNGGNINGTITVHTTVDIAPPFIVRRFTGADIPLKSRHSYPFTFCAKPNPGA